MIRRAAVLLVVLAACRARPAPARFAPGELPADADAVVADLSADDLRLSAAKQVNDTVWRLDFERGGRRFRAKWKPLAGGFSEAQDGFPGNNAPRCELAAWRVNRLLLGDDTARHVVAPVVVRAFHRDVPCDRACAHVPRLPGVPLEVTFPDVNDHLTIGAVTWWIDGVAMPEAFQGGLWDEARFARDAAYAQRFADLVLFLALIAHGDANYDANFLMTSDGHRIYSIDNGRAFDGVPHYTDEADPDWAPFVRLGAERLIAPSFPADTVARLAALDEDVLARELRVVASIDLTTGRAAGPGEPTREPTGEKIWLEGATLRLGIGRQGIADVARRAGALHGATRDRVRSAPSR